MSTPPTEPRPLSADEIESLDALARSLPPLRVPPELLAQTRAAMAAELASETAASSDATTTASVPASTSAAVRRDEAPPAAEVVPLRPRRVGWTLGAVAALAAGALVFLAMPTEPAPAPADRLVERGSGERLPGVALKVAVRRDGATRRHDPSQSVGAGDELYFRAGVDQDARLQLVRVDAGGASVVHAQGAAAGEADLALDGAPLAWAVEAGESDAVFAVLASGTDLDAAVVEGALGAAYDPADPDAACRAALSLGARCDATTVTVQP
jgi:hypothetical protein